MQLSNGFAAACRALRTEKDWRIETARRQRSHFPRLASFFSSGCQLLSFLFLVSARLSSVLTPSSLPLHLPPDPLRPLFTLFSFLPLCGVVRIFFINHLDLRVSSVSRASITELLLLSYPNIFHAVRHTVAGLDRSNVVKTRLLSQRDPYWIRLMSSIFFVDL